MTAAPQQAQADTAAVDTVDISTLPRVKQKLVAPPFLPEHEQVATGGPKIVEVTLDIEEKKMVLDEEGTEVWAFTYNGSVPGPMIVVHEGDYVELTLRTSRAMCWSTISISMPRPGRWAAAR